MIDIGFLLVNLKKKNKNIKFLSSFFMFSLKYLLVYANKRKGCFHGKKISEKRLPSERLLAHGHEL